MSGRTPERLRLPSVAEPSDPLMRAITRRLGEAHRIVVHHSGSGADSCSTWLRSRSRRRPRASSFDGSRSHAALGLLVLFPADQSQRAFFSRLKPPGIARQVPVGPKTTGDERSALITALHIAHGHVCMPCSLQPRRADEVPADSSRFARPEPIRQPVVLGFVSRAFERRSSPGLRVSRRHRGPFRFAASATRVRPQSVGPAGADRVCGQGVQQFLHGASRPERLGRPWRLRGSRALLVTEPLEPAAAVRRVSHRLVKEL
jgi:hypothetical protein